MSLILCLSPAYQPFVRSCRERRVCPSFCVSHRRTSPLCGLVGRDVCVPHFVSLTGVPAFIVRSCRERRVCPSFCVSHRRTSPLCGLVGRDVCVPHFVSLTGVPAFIVRSCRERRVCPSFCVSHRRTSLYPFRSQNVVNLHTSKMSTKLALLCTLTC